MEKIKEDIGSIEKRKVQIIAPAYYARKEIQEAIFKFCKNRETVPRYLEGFGKRPDALDYPSDVSSLVKKGATSFHCSEEIWSNPLSISTDMTPEQYNKIKIGWDFLIDIDSKYLDYAKIAARLIIRFLEHNGMKSVGIKFSGSKGFHILIPWKAFPEEVNGEKTKDKFPEWPRAIAGYVGESIHEKLTEEMIKISNLPENYEIKYKPTGELAIEKKVTHYVCKNCKARMDYMKEKSTKKTLRCHLCNYDMEKISEDIVYVADSNKDNSQKNPHLFQKKLTTKNLIDSVDIVLVAPRHLFRAPYSLHEKTSLVSMVLTKEELENFDVHMADPLKIKIRDYNPDCEVGEARELLMQSLDWAKKKEPPKKQFDGKALDMKGLKINEGMFPPVIQKLLEGMKTDGRKRALSVLLSFFSSLELPIEYIEEKIYEWNNKNYKPLREGYVKSQVDWSLKNKRLPPNYDKPIYKELGVSSETDGLKNPINYTIRNAMRMGFGESNQRTGNKRNLNK